ncbi:MAG TPA: PAS domain S-box protein, partial [Acidimicrobiia bacterium]|nr:PAS domain S-box protein [Acidimicrobiia bacterium]
MESSARPRASSSSFSPRVLRPIHRQLLPEDTTSIPTQRGSAGAAFTRIEPLVVAAFVAHAGYVWASNDTGVWEWSLAGILFVLGSVAATGLFQRDAQLALIRAGLSVGTLVLVGEQAGGTGTATFMIWFGVFAVLFPLTLTARHARFAPPMMTVSYVAVATLGVGKLPLAQAVINSVGFLAGGFAAYILGHVVLDLRAERDTVVDRLNRVEGTLDAAFATAQSGMAILDLDGNFRRVNQAMCDMLGRDEASLLRTSWFSYVHPEARDEHTDRVGRLASAAEWSFQQECRLRLRDRSVSWGMVGMSVVTEKSVPAYLFAHVTDITSRVRSEMLLRQSEAHYRNMFDLSPVPVWELDVTAPVVALPQDSAETLDEESVDRLLATALVRNVNETARALISPTDPLATSENLPSAGIGAGHAAAFRGVIDTIRRGATTGEWGTTMIDDAGSPHFGVMRTLVPTVDGSADYSGVLVAFVDATDRQQAEHALRRIEQRLRTVMAGAPIVLFAVDASGVYTLSEGQALASLGQAAGEAVGRSVFELHRGSPSVIRNLRRALGGDAFTATDEIGELVFETRYSPIWEGGSVGGVIGVSYDITDRVRATEQLRELVRSKDDFVATVSHELRTPLTAVVGFAHELRDGLGKFAMEDVASFVDLIDEQATEVGDLVEDLLVASRAEQGSVPVGRDAIDLWSQVDAVVRARRLGKDVRIEDRDGAAKAFGDAIRVRQIIRNLLTNADRYGGPTIVVRTRRTDDSWVLEVCDDGVGIAPSHRGFIFEPYQRAHTNVGRTESVGLGLTVSRQLARLMGGDLTYERRGAVSVFCLTLPAV